MPPTPCPSLLHRVAVVYVARGHASDYTWIPTSRYFI